MDFESTLMELCNWESGSGLKMLGSEMDAGWVQDALESTGTCSIRRQLPLARAVGVRHGWVMSECAGYG
jgi:hypothetical protein